MAKKLPIHLKRISITREATLDFALSPFPTFPEALRARFPDLKTWELKLDEWRRRSEGDLRRLSTDLREFREESVEEALTTLIESRPQISIPKQGPPTWDEILNKPDCFPACEVAESPEPVVWTFTVNGF